MCNRAKTSRCVLAFQKPGSRVPLLQIYEYRYVQSMVLDSVPDYVDSMLVYHTPAQSVQDTLSQRGTGVFLVFLGTRMIMFGIAVSAGSMITVETLDRC